MSWRNLQPVYLTLDHELTVNHGQISVSSLFGLDYTSPNLFFAFERDYIPYQDIVIGNLPRIDLVTIDISQNNLCLLTSCTKLKKYTKPDSKGLKPY